MLRSLRCAALASACVQCTIVLAQTPAVPKVHLPSYIDPTKVNYAALVPAPPRPDSAAQRTDLAAVHAAEASRTPETIAAARHDEEEEDIFLFATVFGSNFNEHTLPVTAGFSALLRNESGAVNPKLKDYFHRPRPYAVDSTLHPVCQVKPDNGYPSGHAMVGWLLALALTQMVPEKTNEIQHRAQEYAANRVVCGVHFPSDTEASHLVALAMFGNMAASPRFQKDLAASRAEIRRVLRLPDTP